MCTFLSLSQELTQANLNQARRKMYFNGLVKFFQEFMQLLTLKIYIPISNFRVLKTKFKIVHTLKKQHFSKKILSIYRLDLDPHFVPGSESKFLQDLDFHLR